MKLAIEYTLKKSELARLKSSPEVVAYLKAEKEFKAIKDKILGLNSDDSAQYMIDGGVATKSLKSSREFLSENKLKELLKIPSYENILRPHLEIGYKQFNLEVTVL